MFLSISSLYSRYSTREALIFSLRLSFMTSFQYSSSSIHFSDLIKAHYNFFSPPFTREFIPSISSPWQHFFFPFLPHIFRCYHFYRNILLASVTYWQLFRFLSLHLSPFYVFLGFPTKLFLFCHSWISLTVAELPHLISYCALFDIASHLPFPLPFIQYSFLTTLPYKQLFLPHLSLTSLYSLSTFHHVTNKIHYSVLCFLTYLSLLTNLPLAFFPIVRTHLAGETSHPVAVITLLLPSLPSCVNPWIYLCFSENLLNQICVSK